MKRNTVSGAIIDTPFSSNAERRAAWNCASATASSDCALTPITLGLAGESDGDLQPPSPR